MPVHILLSVALLLAMSGSLGAQLPAIRYGDHVPADVKVIYERGLRYLAQSQFENGSWGRRGADPRGSSGQVAITSMCLMAFLASGEDADYGRYSRNVHRAVRNVIMSQDPKTGYLPDSMYHHGFAMLALAEAYGTVTESMIWEGDEPAERRRSVGEALELAVRCAVTAQRKSRRGGWRYSPRDGDSDTSVSGAVLMGLLAARNAGMEVPDEVIDKALNYFRSSTSDNGIVAYAGGFGGFGESMNRSAIATLIYAVGKKSDWKEYDATLAHITKQLDHREQGYPFYFRYYMAQALFQGDFDAWTKWNREVIRKLKQSQQDDGSFQSSQGLAYGTSMSMLALALNYRFLPVYER